MHCRERVGRGRPPCDCAAGLCPKPGPWQGVARGAVQGALPPTHRSVAPGTQALWFLLTNNERNG